jgi:hypothetical protein
MSDQSWNAIVVGTFFLVLSVISWIPVLTDLCYTSSKAQCYYESFKYFSSGIVAIAAFYIAFHFGRSKQIHDRLKHQKELLDAARSEQRVVTRLFDAIAIARDFLRTVKNELNNADELPRYKFVETFDDLYSKLVAEYGYDFVVPDDRSFTLIKRDTINSCSAVLQSMRFVHGSVALQFSLQHTQQSISEFERIFVELEGKVQNYNRRIEKYMGDRVDTISSLTKSAGY